MFVSSEIVVVFLGFIAMTLSMPAKLHKRNSDNEVQVLKYHDDRNVDGSYDFKWDKNLKLFIFNWLATQMRITQFLSTSLLSSFGN